MKPPPPYVDADIERFLTEPGWSERSAFERDRARIVHSAGLRRLAAKTQVVGPSTDDFTRNRLTHTLEVAQVGRDLAHALGCDPDLVEAACLAHDLGHPPFGHNGERALNEAAADIGGFEGNAQTLRLLSRLEAKSLDVNGRSLGLNLTRATLDAATKYPWRLGQAPSPQGRHGDGMPREVRKFGVYEDDAEVFAWMRAGRDDSRVCVEAQVMDFADDVAYSVHDVEDGIVSGRIDLAQLRDAGLRQRVWETTRDWYASQLSVDEAEAAYERLAGHRTWPQASYDGSRVVLAGLKNLTSGLINRFCQAVQTAADEQGVTAHLTRYAGDLPVPGETRAEIVLLKGIAAHLVMKADDRVEVLERQRMLLAELVAALWWGAPNSLEAAFRHDFDAADDDAAQFRVVIDQVASLTDLSAVDAHRRLVGSA
ncbi:MAG: deoxyguanosinetriphosphate triphosphohydrolase [Propionibacteriales bacterium]|nr:deoxyguanosinetriphosphate triphosphohydrolase [Propionibacteriales bacterium]